MPLLDISEAPSSEKILPPLPRITSYIPSSKATTSSQDRTMNLLNPWLGLRARLFLSLFPYALIALLFVGTRLIISASQVDQDISRSNNTIWTACRETEQAISALASFPHLLADNFNSATKRSVDETVKGLGSVLILSITAVESLLSFLVDMYRSMFLCFIQFVVQASLALLISALQLFSSAVHDIAQSIQATIDASVDAINAGLSATLTGFNDILEIIGKSVTVPTVPYPNLTALNNVSIPSTLQDSLIQLNNSLPTLSDLKTKIDLIIDTPFELLKTQVNDTITGYTFNQSALPIPPVLSISYCNDTLDTQTLADLRRDLRKTAHVGIGLLILLAILLLLINVVREWYSWHSLKRHVANTREAFLHSGGEEKRNDLLSEYSIFSLLQLSMHPLLSDWGLRSASRIGIRSSEGKTRFCWWMAWISHPAAVVLLSMGAIGLLSVELQIAAVNRISHRYEGSFQDMLTQSSNDIQTKLDMALQGLSIDYANKSNIVLLEAQEELNSNLFTWVNVTTSTMNNTLNEFMDGIATAIYETFSNTPLYTPVQSFIDCVLGQKVKGIEDGLTWMHSNAHANFPLVPDNVLMISANTTEQVMQPLKDSALGSDGVLADVIGSYLSSLKKERVLFLILLLLYLLLVLAGTLIALTRGSTTFRQLFHRGRSQDNNLVSREELVPHIDTLTDMYQRTESPAVVSSHRSISNPLHPDVVSLYRQEGLTVSDNGSHDAVKCLPVRHSWESIDSKQAPLQSSFVFADPAEEVQLQRHGHDSLHRPGSAF